MCDGNHPIFFCEKFKEMKVSERKEVVKQKSLCMLCLRPNHTATECSYKRMCPTCDKRHNGLLHYGDSFEPRKNDSKHVKRSFVAVTEAEEQEVQQIVACTAIKNEDEDEEKADIYLATALVRIKTNNGWSETFRALIDQGSMSTFCTERLVTKLELTKKTKFGANYWNW